nr:hypothetical protein [Rhizobium leguminosarum]
MDGWKGKEVRIKVYKMAEPDIKTSIARWGASETHSCGTDACVWLRAWPRHRPTGTPAVIDHSEEAEYAWKIWSLDWPDPSPGEHTVTSRAINTAGQIQPAMDDPLIAKKHTYWESNGQVTRRIRIV